MLDRRTLVAVAGSVVVLLTAAGPAQAQSGAYVSPVVEPTVFEGDLSEGYGGPPRPGNAPAEGRGEDQESVADRGDGTARTPGDAGDADVSAPVTSFEGLRLTGAFPPDPTGEIGPNHYVEAINFSFRIYNRAGTPLIPQTNFNTLWTGAGGLCEVNNDGDPIVLYDQLADRWILAQFAFTDPSTGPWAMCIAVSRTPDPVSGGWFAYEYAMTAFPDYEKFGVWRDGLYMSTFESTNLGVFAFDRAAMLAGTPGSFVKFTTPASDQPRGSRLLPADIDGDTLNPAGTPNVFVQAIDGDLTASGTDVDRLELFEFRRNPNSFVKVADLPTAPFDNGLCYSIPSPFRDCIPQAGTSQKIDPLAGRLMWRASYRNFGDHEAIVLNHTVDTNGADLAGIRWYELRRTGSGPWSIFQQGTYSPDSTHRFQGSAAINRIGEIGLGYTASSSTISPGLRYTGRTPADPAGQMSAEQVLAVGPESQTGSNRWGDYSHMSIDPLDDCTMWYVGEYGDRRSRIGSFQVTDCLPETTISPGPSVPTNDNTPTFTLSGDEPNLRFECSVDGGAFAPCPATYTPTLGDGPHTVAARAVAKGSVDPTPATTGVVVDTQAPQAKISKKAKLKNGRLLVKVKCKDTEDCEGSLDVKKDKKPKQVDIGDGDNRTIKVAVKPSVDQGDKLKATLVLTDDAGNQAQIKKKLTVK